MLTGLIITQTVVVGASTSFIIYKLSRMNTKRTGLKLVGKDKNGFKHYRAY